MKVWLKTIKLLFAIPIFITSIVANDCQKSAKNYYNIEHNDAAGNKEAPISVPDPIIWDYGAPYRVNYNNGENMETLNVIKNIYDNNYGNSEKKNLFTLTNIPNFVQQTPFISKNSQSDVNDNIDYLFIFQSKTKIIVESKEQLLKQKVKARTIGGIDIYDSNNNKSTINAGGQEYEIDETKSTFKMVFKFTTDKGPKVYGSKFNTKNLIIKFWLKNKIDINDIDFFVDDESIIEENTFLAITSPGHKFFDGLPVVKTKRKLNPHRNYIENIDPASAPPRLQFTINDYLFKPALSETFRSTSNVLISSYSKLTTAVNRATTSFADNNYIIYRDGSYKTTPLVIWDEENKKILPEVKYSNMVDVKKLTADNWEKYTFVIAENGIYQLKIVDLIGNSINIIVVIGEQHWSEIKQRTTKEVVVAPISNQQQYQR